MIKIINSNIVRCFDSSCVGTKVVKQEELMALLVLAVQEFDWTGCQTPGQAYIPLVDDACGMVASGVGKKTNNPDDYVIREWRGQCGMYLKREKGLPPDSVAAVVYTKQAYLDDPDCKGDPEKGIPGDPEEMKRVQESDCTHVLVIVLANAGPRSPVSPHRFVANLAGANNEYAEKTGDELRAMAREIRDYHDEYSVVAD